MNPNPEVDAWFAALEHPLKPVMQRLRELILAADPRMRDQVQYGTVQFACGGPTGVTSAMAGLVQVKDRKRVSLMFNAAGRLKGTYPHLEGNKIKYLRLTSLSDVEACADELQTITREWCALSARA